MDNDLIYIENETIITENSTNEDIQKIATEIKKFNLDDFLHSKSGSTGGVGLITKNQMIITDTFAKLRKSSTYGSHIDSLIEIYKVIYGLKPMIINLNDPKKLVNWQEEVLKDGNILIQFCEPKTMETLIWLPANIDNKQSEFLEILNQEIKNIIESDLEYFEENPVILTYDYQNEYYEEKNSLNYLIEQLKKPKQKRR